jgi:hypothetical protein
VGGPPQLPDGCVVQLEQQVAVREPVPSLTNSTWCHSVVPLSVHPCGEALRWEKFGDAAMVGVTELDWSERKIAAAALLAIHWPRLTRLSPFLFCGANALSILSHILVPWLRKQIDGGFASPRLADRNGLWVSS